MSTTDLAKALLERRGSPRVSARQFSNLTKKLNAALNTKFRQGVVTKAGRADGGQSAVVWRLRFP